jgi:hypothetical protein
MAANLKSAPTDRAAPLAAAILLVAGVELHPLGALVDVEQAPFRVAASRLFAANSNTCVPPLIRPYYDQGTLREADCQICLGALDIIALFVSTLIY